MSQIYKNNIIQHYFVPCLDFNFTKPSKKECGLDAAIGVQVMYFILCLILKFIIKGQNKLNNKINKGAITQHQMSGNISMNFFSPSKSALVAKSESISPKKNWAKTSKIINFSNSPYRSQIVEEDSAQSSLVYKMIENQIGSEEQYQNVLIRNKQMQIRVLGLEEEAQQLKKQLKRANRPIQQVKQKVQNSRLSLIQKQKYLQKFYLHLDSKLKSNMHSNLFGRLQKVQTTLEQRYQQQRIELYDSLSSQHEKIETANQQLEKLRVARDLLIREYAEKAIQTSFHQGFSGTSSPSGKKSNPKSSRCDRKSQTKQIKLKMEQAKRSQIKKNKQSAKREVKDECQFLKDNITKLKKQKQISEKDQRILKMLLNIDEEHRKYSAYILNGFKKIFTIKYRELLCKRRSKSSSASHKQSKSTPPVPLPAVQRLQRQLGQKTAQRKILLQEIKERNLGLQKCKQKLNQQIAEYSDLQQQIMKVSDRNKGPNNNRATYQHNGKRNQNQDEYSNNPRSTYSMGPNNGNYRSTYTSYKNNSHGQYQDL